MVVGGGGGDGGHAASHAHLHSKSRSEQMRGLEECAANRLVSSDAATTAVGEVAAVSSRCSMARRAKNMGNVLCVP